MRAAYLDSFIFSSNLCCGGGCWRRRRCQQKRERERAAGGSGAERSCSQQLFGEFQCLSRMESNVYLEFDLNPEGTDKLVNTKPIRKNLCHLLSEFVIKCEGDVWSRLAFVHSFIYSTLHVKALGSQEGGKNNLA